MDAQELSDWLRLLHTPDVGRETARRLLAAFGAPGRVFEAAPEARRAVVGETLAERLADPPPGLSTLVETTLAWLAGGSSESPRTILTLDRKSVV